MFRLHRHLVSFVLYYLYVLLMNRYEVVWMDHKLYNKILGFMMLYKLLKCLLTIHLIDKLYKLIFYLFSKSFVLTTLGFTWVAFALGAISWWGPKFLQLAHTVYSGNTDDKTKAK